MSDTQVEASRTRQEHGWTMYGKASYGTGRKGSGGGVTGRTQQSLLTTSCRLLSRNQETRGYTCLGTAVLGGWKGNSIKSGIIIAGDTRRLKPIAGARRRKVLRLS